MRGSIMAIMAHGSWGQKYVSYRCDSAAPLQTGPAQVTPGVLTARMLPVPDRWCEGARWNHSWERSSYEPRGESVLKIRTFAVTSERYHNV